ncbi:exported hypothetical protein [Paraburkholderia unamae]|uniref:hypothetical protein n=1 Tax=Paraburkholderia unamae TaxID=219649 RepID=UPI001CB3B082|nr:hypothetical protein [Paraburkholderia unamae]CAG9268268.1 exported hypothetical protein [Paraburkholderia unamae]
MQPLSHVPIGFSILSLLYFTTSSAQIPAASVTDLAASAPSGTSASALGLTDLIDDQYRGQLFANIKSAYTANDPKGAAEAVRHFDL